MDSIISISDEVVSIRTTEGDIEEVRRCDLSFEPNACEFVECFFLGGFSAHKFYADKTGAGIVYINFC